MRQPSSPNADKKSILSQIANVSRQSVNVAKGIVFSRRRDTVSQSTARAPAKDFSNTLVGPGRTSNIPTYASELDLTGLQLDLRPAPHRLSIMSYHSGDLLDNALSMAVSNVCNPQECSETPDVGSDCFPRTSTVSSVGDQSICVAPSTRSTLGRSSIPPSNDIASFGLSCSVSANPSMNSILAPSDCSTACTLPKARWPARDSERHYPRDNLKRTSPSTVSKMSNGGHVPVPARISEKTSLQEEESIKDDVARWFARGDNTTGSLPPPAKKYRVRKVLRRKAKRVESNICTSITSSDDEVSSRAASKGDASATMAKSEVDLSSLEAPSVLAEPQTEVSSVKVRRSKVRVRRSQRKSATNAEDASLTSTPRTGIIKRRSRTSDRKAFELTRTSSNILEMLELDDVVSRATEPAANESVPNPLALGVAAVATQGAIVAPAAESPHVDGMPIRSFFSTPDNSSDEEVGALPRTFSFGSLERSASPSAAHVNLQDGLEQVGDDRTLDPSALDASRARATSKDTWSRRSNDSFSSCPGNLSHTTDLKVHFHPRLFHQSSEGDLDVDDFGCVNSIHSEMWSGARPNVAVDSFPMNQSCFNFGHGGLDSDDMDPFIETHRQGRKSVTSLSGRASLKIRSRFYSWRQSRILDLTRSELFARAMHVVVGGDQAMHPERATCGYKMLQRMKALVEGESLDDRPGREIVENLFFDSIPRSRVQIGSIEPVLKVELLKRFLRKVADECASVEICWHGTQEKYVEPILEGGLNPDLCATGAYGRGAYVGTHAGVAHQYADPNEEGWRHMCAMLVVVGSSVVKGKQGEQSAATACDRLVNPTQYCFVEEDRLYTTHLVTYKVPPQNKRRTGGGYEDPFQRKLAAAVSKAARDRNKEGVR